MNSIEWLKVSGYKTLKDLEFIPHNLNVLIGANGSGKSNLISIFRMLSEQFESDGRLQDYIGHQRGANAILHDGAKVTQKIEIDLCIFTDRGRNDYFCRLELAAGDTLYFSREAYRLSDRQGCTVSEHYEFGAGHR